MIRASIDIGSNSVLLLACEFDVANKKIVRELLNLSYVTSLGKDLDKTKKFNADSMKATYDALADYKNHLSQIGFPPEKVIVTATEASRVAQNALEFYSRVRSELGFCVQLISPEGEAHYTALGVASAVSDKNELVIMDMGGASTELIRVKLHPFKIHSTISLPVGSVRATDWRTEHVFNEKIQELFKNDLSQYISETLLCVAGSMTSLASMYLGQKSYDDKKIDGLCIKFSSFKDFARDLQATNVENLLMLFPQLGKRAPLISAAAEVAVMIGEKCHCEIIQISTRGLRYGVLIQGGINDQFTIG
jgi:exopolyphosphatase/guanosine-5'-triphosphate,3'-diphosphate pyrophosphatase